MEPRLKICSYLWMADGDVVWCAHLITHCTMVVVAVYAVLCTWWRQHWGSLLQPVPDGPGSPAVKRLWCTIKPKSRYFCVSWPHKKRTEVKYWRLPYWHSPRGSSGRPLLSTFGLDVCVCISPYSAQFLFLIHFVHVQVTFSSFFLYLYFVLQHTLCLIKGKTLNFRTVVHLKKIL